MPTLFGIIRNAAGAALNASKLKLRPQSALVAGAGVRSVADIDIVTSSAGYFSQAVEPGSYYLWLDGSGRSSIYVPDSPEYILLGDLFSGATGGTPTVGTNWRLSSAQRQLLHATSGVWQAPVIDDTAGTKSLDWGTAGAGTATANFRHRDGMLELYCADTDTWHAPLLDDSELTLAAHGATAQILDRIRCGAWQLKDQTTGYWHTWSVIGSAGSESVVFGPPER